MAAALSKENPGRRSFLPHANSSLYTSLATLPQRAGVPASMLPWLVVKELCDNALDAADAAGRPGVVEIEIDDQGNLTIADKGAGIPDATPEQIAHLFSVGRPMLSSKLLRRPTRGAVGNGLRVCLGYLTATGGRPVIETGSLRVELSPADRRHQPRRQQHHKAAARAASDRDRWRCTVRRGASGLGAGCHRTGAAIGQSRLHRPAVATLVRPRSFPGAVARRGRKHLG